MLQNYKNSVTPLLRLSATNQSNSPPPHPSCRSKTKQWQEIVAAFLVANFLEIELGNLTLLILLGGGPMIAVTESPGESSQHGHNQLPLHSLQIFSMKLLFSIQLEKQISPHTFPLPLTTYRPVVSNKKGTARLTSNVISFLKTIVKSL